MPSIVLQVLAAWVAAAVFIGLMVGASIRFAERLRIEGVKRSILISGQDTIQGVRLILPPVGRACSS